MFSQPRYFVVFPKSKSSPIHALKVSTNEVTLANTEEVAFLTHPEAPQDTTPIWYSCPSIVVVTGPEGKRELVAKLLKGLDNY